MDKNPIEPFAGPVLKLLKGSLDMESDSKFWDILLVYEKPIRTYLGKIGLELHLDKTDGYAFLRQTSDENDSTEEEEGNSGGISLPKLTVRRALNRKETILILLLREALQDWEEKNPELSPLVRRTFIYEMLDPFFPETGNQVDRYKEFDRLIAKMLDYGFLRDMKEDHFKIMSIIKAKLPVDELQELRNILSKGAVDRRDNHVGDGDALANQGGDGDE